MALSKAEIAARYGTALFDYAQDMDALTAVHADIIKVKKLKPALLFQQCHWIRSNYKN